MKHTLTLLTVLLLAPLAALHAAESLPTPAALWKDYDPNQGDFKEEIVKQETRDGVFHRDSYISVHLLGEEIRVYCRYSVKAGAAKAPGLLSVHGWMGAPSPDRTFVEDGWAVMAHDYCGKTRGRPHFTKYPEKLRHGNMDRTIAGPARAQTLDGAFITDPTQTSDYVWYAIQRRVLSYLEQQKEVDRTRLGAMGYSYGGTLMWNLATDPRVKAVAAYFGIGYNDYYRDKRIWLYNVPYLEPPKSSGEEIILASIVPEAHVPFITAATLFLNGSNDHHGGHERGLESFKKFPKNVPWSFAIQARGHHDTEKIGHNTKFWFDKHVLGKDVTWPEHPRSQIRLDPEGVPELVITPATPDKVRKVEIFYALKEPCSFTRSWRDTPSVRQGQQWVAKMPVLSVDDYVFGYANLTYDTTIVRSTDFNAAIPAKLGKAKATDKPSDNLSESGYSDWSNIAELEGPKGIKGLATFIQAGGTAVYLQGGGPNAKWGVAGKASPLLPVSARSKQAVGTWTGIPHLVKDHPIFDGLPVNGMMGPIYENVWAENTLQDVAGEPIVAAIGYDWFPDYDLRKRHYIGPGDTWWGADMAIVPLGKGRCIASQLRLLENLGKDPVADRLLFNLITFASH